MADRTCTINGCGNRYEARGWCRTHYMRWRRHGDPEHRERLRGEPVDVRFWSKVDRTGECWTWTGGKYAEGYGRFWDGERDVAAHRFAYELEVGPIPDGTEIDHTCHNDTGCLLSTRCPHRACVNPAHLEAVTHAVNSRRGYAGHHLASRTHCPQGHPYAGDNLAHDADGSRRCRTCSNHK